MTVQAFSNSPGFSARSVDRRRPLFGLIRNKPHQNRDGAVFDEQGYTLAIVEFDDQGVCYDRRQMDALTATLAPLEHQSPVILVFVHGWKHNARDDDSNLQSFRKILAQTVRETPDHPVLGVFVAWRGLSWYGPPFLPVENVTFFSRKEAALRVALGSVRELLGKLRAFRNDRVDTPEEPVLVIVGHSFGGLIVYSAVAQSLIEAAATEQGRLVPSFANLVLLVNPAFEAVRYLPVFQQIENIDRFLPGQPPVFVSVTAENDWATGYAFPIGESLATIGESTLGRRERQALRHTMGHLSWMQTHRLSGRRAAAPRRGEDAPRADLLTSAQEEQTSSGGAVLRRLPGGPAANPFWVVRASPEVINGHNGIFGEMFVGFVHDLVATQMAHARSTREPPPGSH